MGGRPRDSIVELAVSQFHSAVNGASKLCVKLPQKYSKMYTATLEFDFGIWRWLYLLLTCGDVVLEVATNVAVGLVHSVPPKKMSERLAFVLEVCCSTVVAGPVYSPGPFAVFLMLWQRVMALGCCVGATRRRRLVGNFFFRRLTVDVVV